MTPFIHSLESRRLFSVTSETLLGDKAAVIADAAAVKAALNVLIASDTSATKVIAADFKGLPKADEALLKALVTDETKAKSLLLKAISLLDSPASSAAKQAVSAGDAVLKKATTGSLATLSKDITKLENVTPVPLSNLQALLTSTTLADARTQILIALPEDTALDTVVADEEASTITQRATIGADADQLQTDVATLAADLTSVHTALGTFPDIIGVFTGTAEVTSGKQTGTSEDITLVISSESSDGIIEGTVSDLAGGVAAFAGAITLNGAVTLKALPGNGEIKITGAFSEPAVAGVFSFVGGKGTFAVSE